MTGSIAIFLAFAIPAVLFAVICVLNRAWAVTVFAALLPAYLLRTTVGLPGAGLPELPTTLLEILFLELFTVWLFTDGLKKGAWQAWGRWAYPLALILLGATAGALVSPDLRGAAGLWRAYFLEPILFFTVFADSIRTPKQRLAVIAGLGATLTVIGLTAIIQKITGFGIPNPVWQAAATRRVTGFFGFPNAIGLFAAPVSVLSAAWFAAWVRSKNFRLRVWSVFPAAAAALGAAASLFAVSKGALLAAVVGLAIFGLLLRPLRAPTLGVIIAACLVVSLVGPVRNRAGSLVSGRDDSGSVRLIIWRETAAMLADHPVFGAGLSGYQKVIEPYHQAKYIEIFMYPHNIVMNFWSEIGLIGLAGFIWLLTVFFRETIRLLRTRSDSWLPPALIAAMAALLVHGLVDVPYFKNDLAMLFFILIGLAESLAAGADAAAPVPASMDKKAEA